ncbi:hypothetical protein ME788_04980 [Lactobacillus delbrueckii]|nr:hypothetical protein ME788_04980 [Lactobacillus delbrueckii]
MFNGIIVIDKAAGMTSGDVVYKLRRLLKQKKDRPCRNPGPGSHRSFANCFGSGNQTDRADA